MLDDDPAFRSLMDSLAALGPCEPLTLPGVDDPMPAPAYIAQVLALMQPRGVSFEEAWSSAINRIQAPQGEGGFIEDPAIGAVVLEERALLEEIRPHFQASYERRPLTTIERARCTVGAWRRLDAGFAALGSKKAA